MSGTLYYWGGWAGGAVVIGAAWYLSTADHRAKVSGWVKRFFSKEEPKA